MTVSRTRTDMSQLCREVLEELRVVHPTRDFRFEATGNTDGEWDPSRIRQLVSNLLGNAVQHGSTTTPIHLFCRTEGDEVVIGVRNEGKPIPKDAIPRIFDPLRRNANEEITRPAGSIGLGLYIAREVAWAHGGKIEVTSDTDGTVFLVRLPRRDQVAAR